VNRVLEEEVMDGHELVDAYSSLDFSESNTRFVEFAEALMPTDASEIIDLGCGPGDVAILLAKRSRAHITAIDASEEMIKFAGRSVAAERLEHRVTLKIARIPTLELPSCRFNVVLSKDFLHHLPDPKVLWSEIARIGAPQASVLVMDLIRPVSVEVAQTIVDRAAPHAKLMIRQDFLNSLCAAFTVAEVKNQLRAANLGFDVRLVTDRHLCVFGKLP
jgi:ubiquinone/menaquinone biosynthesis C-methylase UbiE